MNTDDIACFMTLSSRNASFYHIQLLRAFVLTSKNRPLMRVSMKCDK